MSICPAVLRKMEVPPVLIIILSADKSGQIVSSIFQTPILGLQLHKKATPENGGRNLIDMSAGAYLHRERAASSAMTTQLGCNCRMEAGQEG